MRDDAGGMVRLWDAPVRIIHWAFVLLFPGLWWSAEKGDLALHQRLGYCMLALVVFRVLWGLFGSSTARFASFVKGPTAVFAYVRTLLSKSGEEKPGHNPLGAVSIIALLGLLTAQVSLGLFAQDEDAIESGPLSYLVSYEGADAAREWHHSLFDVLLVLVGIHVFAIAFYLFYKRDNLVKPMITGKKHFAKPVVAMESAPLWRTVVIGIFSAGFSFWISQGAPLF